MVAIVSGLAPGLELGSRMLHGQPGAPGEAPVGRNGQSVHVNIATGNLVLQNQDEQLAARGADHAATRTYNSAGVFDEDNGDQWRMDVVRVRLEGTLLAAGSTLRRTDRDGSTAVYAYDSARGLYVTTEGRGAHDTIAYRAADAQFEWRDGSTGATQRFEATGAGRLLRSADASGNALTYGYAASGLLVSVAADNGDATFYDYEGANLVQLRTVAGGLTNTRVRYAYDGANRLSTVTVDHSPDDNSIADGNAYRTWYTYEGSSRRVAQASQSDGSVLAFTYIDLGGGDYRVASIQDAQGQLTRFSYGAGLATVTDPLGLVTRYEFDAGGRITRIATPGVSGVAAERFFTYSAAGDMLSVTDGENRTIWYEYDARGNQVLQRDSAGGTVRRTFDAANRLLTESTYATPDPDGAGPALPSAPATTRHVYDTGERGLLRYVVSADGGVVEHRYNGFGERIATLTYAADRFPVAALPPDIAPEEADLQAWSAAQAASTIQRADMTYDARGQLQSRSTPGAAGPAIERFVHDQAGRLLQTIDANGGVTRYGYDGLGRVLTRTDALGQTHVTLYDDAGRRTVETRVGGLVRTSAYDASGRLASVTESDTAGVLLGETRYFHDAAGRLRMVRDPAGTWKALFYDEAGRTLAEIDGNGTLTEHAYDRAGQRVRTLVRATPAALSALVTPAGTPLLEVTLAAIRPPDSAADRATWWQYDAAGRLLRQAEVTGDGSWAAVTEQRYDGAGRLMQVVRYATTVPTGSVAPGAIPVPQLSSEDRVERRFHDETGRLAASLDAEGYLTTFLYTAAGQLCERVTHATRVVESQRLDATLQQLLPAASAADRRERTLYDTRGQAIGHVDAEHYLTETVYDAAGNVAQTIRYATRVAAAALTDTQLAGLRPASSPADRVTTRSHDALHRLMQETREDGAQTRYVYDAEGRLVSTTTAAGTNEARTLLARYDVQGRLVAELSPEGAALLTGGQPAEEVAAVWAQHATTHAYDAAGRRISSTDALGRRTLFFHDADGAVTHTINALGEVEEARYDSSGRVTERIAYAGRLDPAAWQGGLAGEALRAALAAIANADRDGHTVFTYTHDGQVATRTEADGLRSAWSYNAFGDAVRREQQGAAVNEAETYAVDRLGRRLVTTADAGGVHAITRAVHDAFGQVTRTVAANGQVREHAYDRLGRVVSTRDPLNALRSSSYDAFGRVFTQTDALGHVTTYAYDAANRAMTVTTPEGVALTTTYDRHGQVQSVRDGEGQTTSYRYDRAGRLVETVRPLATTRSAHDAAGQLVETVDANGVRVTYDYDAAGRVLRRRLDPGGLDLVTSYAYDGRGQRVSVTDANGVVTQTEYDRAGRVFAQTVDPDGLALRTLYTHDARGNLLTVTSPGGSVTEYAYDALGRRVAERIDPQGLDLRRSWSYDASGNVVSSSDARGQLTHYFYDGADRLVLTVDPSGAVQRNVHDAEGRVVKAISHAAPISMAGLAAARLADIEALVVHQPEGDGVEHRVYDRDGRLAATVDGRGAVVRYSHDARGSVTDRVAYATAIDLATWTPGTLPAVSADASRDARLSTVYDAIGRPAYTVDGTGAVVAYTYDGEGRVLEKTAFAQAIASGTPRTVQAIEEALAGQAQPGKDARTRHAYDAAGRLIASVDGNGSARQWVYDANGNILRAIERATLLQPGAVPTAIPGSAADRIRSFAYDAANRLVMEVDPLGAATRRLLDADGRLLQEIAYAEPLARLPVPGEGAEAIAAMLVASAGQDRSTWFGYDAAGRQVLTVRADGAAIEQQFDGQGNVIVRTAYATLVDLSLLPSPPSLAALRTLLVAGAEDRTSHSLFDASGRLTYDVDALGGVTRFTHDALGRLLETRRFATTVALSSATRIVDLEAALLASPSDRSDTHTYDAAGNRVSTRDAAGGVESWSFDALGRTTRFVDKKGAEWTYQHDAAGRRIRETSPSVTLVHTTAAAAGEQLLASSPEEVRITTLLAYDALGNLVQRTEAAGRPEERVTRYEYDAAARQVGVLFPTVMVYDPDGDDLTANLGSVGRKEVARALQTRTFYNAFGEAVANRDVGGGLSQKAYDGAGRLLYDIDAAGFVTSYGYGAFGEATRLTRHASSTNLAERQVNAAAQAASCSEVEAALAAGTQQELDRTLQTTYDGLGRVVETRQPQAFAFDTSLDVPHFWAQARTVRAYNAFGELVQEARARDHTDANWFLTTHYFDALGRGAAVVDAAGYLTTRSYDRFGNLAEVKEHAQALSAGSWNLSAHGMPTASTEDRLTRYAYDGLDRKVSETRVQVEYSTGPEGATVRGDVTTQFAYDAVGNQTGVTDALGQCTWTYYDALSRVRAVATPYGTDGSKTLTLFRRDAHGNAVVKIEHATPAAASATAYQVPQATASDGATLTQFDSLGRALAVQDANGHLAFTSYDAAGNVAKTWRTVTDSLPDASGNRRTRTIFQRNIYDALGRLATTLTPASTTVLRGGLEASYEDAPVRFGANKLTLTWSSLVDPAQGDVRVAVDYLTTAGLMPSGEDAKYVASTVETLTRRLSVAEAAGGAELSWTTPTDSVLHIRVTQLHAGQWKVLWEGPLAKANGSGMSTVSQATAGLVHTRQGFNAFGEMTSRENGQGGEYFHYDTAGRLWRTNSGDGVDKILLHDLQGNVTSEIRSEGAGGSDRDLLAVSSAEEAHATSDMRRLDMQYDPLGRLASRTESRRIRSEGTVSVAQQYITATVLKSGQAPLASGEGPAPARMNEIKLTWNDLGELGPGDLTVLVEYKTPLTRRGGGVDEYGSTIPITYTGGVVRSYQTSLLVGDWHATSDGLRWEETSTDPDASGVGHVVRVRLMKKDVDGTLRVLFDQAPGYGPHEIRIAAPADPQTLVKLLSRQVGTTEWVDAPGALRNFGTVYRYDATGLGVGSHDYRVEMKRPGETEFALVASGQVKIAMPALANISTPITFGQASRLAGPLPQYIRGALSWAHQDFAVQQVLRYRLAGTDNAWKTLPIELFSEGQRDGVDCTGLAAGSYQFELLWSAAGQGVPTSHATGTFKVIPPQPSEWVPPVGLPKVPGVKLGFMIVPANGYSEATLEKSVPALLWDACGADVVRYLRNGQWAYLTINNQFAYSASPEAGNGTQRASLEALGVGTHTIEVRRMAGSNDLLTKLRYVVSSTGTRTLTDISPAYKPGYWTAAVPTSYSVSVSTKTGSPAISTTQGMRMNAPTAQWELGQQWERPVVHQNTDRWGNVVAITDPRSANWVTTYRFNWNNQMIQQTLPAVADAGAAQTQIYFDALGRQVAVRDANGNVNGQAFDAAGNLVEEIHADGGVVRHAYDARSRRINTVDAMGNTVAFGYDATGNKLWLDKGPLYVYRYDGAQLLSKTVENVVERWSYDELGQRQTHTDGNGAKRTYVYDLRGNVVQTIQPLGQKTQAAFDTGGRKTAEVDANAVAATWRYDYFGRLAAHTDLGGARYTYTYDNAAQLVRQKNTRGQDLTYKFDRAGLLTTIADAALDQTTTYMYDEAGRRIRERVVQAGITYQDNHLGYDARGNLRDVSDARAHLTIDYDAVGNRTMVRTRVGYISETGSAKDRDMSRWFLYDEMNRQVVAEAVDASGKIDEGGGHIITYDKRGNRTSDTSFRHTTKLGASVITGYRNDGSAIQGESSTTYQNGYFSSKEVYRYDAANRLQSIVRDGVQVDHRHYDGADRVVHSGPVELPGGYLAAVRSGLASGQSDGLDRTYNYYDANGRIVKQVVLEGDGGTRAEVSWNPDASYGGLKPNGYDGVGNSKGHVVWNKDANTVSEYTTTFVRFDGHQAGMITGRTAGGSTGTTTHDYDANGFLVGIVDSTLGANNRIFVNDASGKALYVKQGGHVQRQLIVNGEVLGIYGVGVDEDRPKDGSGNPNFANIVDFGFGYAPITSTHPNPAPGNYVVRAGDTLQGIAHGAYGDSALWYRIAEANGLASSNDLKVGQTLNLPNRVATIHNNDSTFKPYDPSRITGDTTPNLPMPDSGGCGGAGQLLMAVVAIVVTIYTAGAAAGVLGSSSATTFSTGLAALAGGSAGGVTIGGGLVSGAVASVSGAAIGGAVGSVASQLVGMAAGAVDTFSWKNVALSAVSAGASAEIGAYARVTPGLLQGPSPSAVVARALVANTMTQGVGVALGLQKRFDWRGVAASGVGAAVGNAIVDAGGQPPPVGSAEAIVRATAIGLMAGVAAAAARGGRIVVQQIAVDAFGNALGQSLANASSVPAPAATARFPEVVNGDSVFINSREGALPELASMEGLNRQLDSYSPAEVDPNEYELLADASQMRGGPEPIGLGFKGRSAIIGAPTTAMVIDQAGGSAATQQRHAITLRMLEEALARAKALAPKLELERSLNTIRTEADAYQESGLSGATGDVAELIAPAPEPAGSGLRVSSRAGSNMQSITEGINPSSGVIDHFARGFRSQASSWSVLEGEKPLAYSIGAATRAGLGLVYDGLTGAGDFRAAGQAWSRGEYVSASMYGLRGLGSAGLTAATLGEYALARAAFAGSIGSTGTNTGLQIFRGGAYGRLETGRPGIHRHHMPADSVSPMTTYSGPSIQMEIRDHVLTSSHGTQGLAGAEYRAEIQQLIQSGETRRAMAREIWDVRRAAVEGGGGVTKYNSAIREMLEYSYSRGLLGK